MHFDLERSNGPGGARAGRIRVGDTAADTPVFMPVGTQATVKALTPDELAQMGAQVVLCNAYHLYVRPGVALIERLGGLHRFMDWKRLILTDSGGYQVFSISSLQKTTSRGVRFRSHIDGSEHFLTPEDVIQCQLRLDSDIIMVLDECTGYSAGRDTIIRSLNRTMEWARRSRAAWPETSRRGLFGIVQGGVFGDLRARACRGLVDLDFDGYAVGGLSVGEPLSVRRRVVRETVRQLPESKPRYLMGIGTPEELLDGVAAGVDMFDCALPTRVARNGTIFTWTGKRNLRNARYRTDDGPLDLHCRCEVCRRYSRAYVRHLVVAREILGARLTTYHNLYFLMELMRKSRRAIVEGRFFEFREAFRERFHRSGNK